ncbi:GNAT family N-acetyltransferase [Polyangium jinanense]|uniref:GNAT family N-acetyltransferase n=1 Tax=Polyangium jinanense TaxID=2829994 RepID=A0A9X3XGM9_9BACT|nr:GNAT family N-acetyltransferase [Polyangium jinanense]MDC3961518.1 GNAT family N-acetyltransferase [Polyangium jinanense]MDC3989035.1 GNAT family N-acetyltransferase [Polyangium jinanense]
MATLEIIEDDEALRDWVDVVDAADVWGIPSFEDARHLRGLHPGRVDGVLRLDGRPVGAAFVRPAGGESAEPCGIAGLWVIPAFRCQGLGSAMHRAFSEHARRLGLRELQIEAHESQHDARVYLERRGYEEIGREVELVLELDALPMPEVKPPAGITLVTRAERPDVLAGMYQVAKEAIPDIPVDEADEVGSFEEWLATDMDRPIHTHDLTFIAMEGAEVVGYAVLQRGRGGVAFHSLTGVRRAWRGRGIASALKRAQVAAAKRAGFRRLVTENAVGNEPIRHLNEVMGYKPLMSTILYRGPLLDGGRSAR